MFLSRNFDIAALLRFQVAVFFGTVAQHPASRSLVNIGTLAWLVPFVDSYLHTRWKHSSDYKRCHLQVSEWQSRDYLCRI